MKGHLAVLGADLAEARRSGYRVPHRGTGGHRGRRRNSLGLTGADWNELRTLFRADADVSQVAGPSPQERGLACRIGEAVQLIREEWPGEAFADLLISVLTGSDTDSREAAA